MLGSSLLLPHACLVVAHAVLQERKSIEYADLLASTSACSADIRRRSGKRLRSQSFEPKIGA